MNPQEGDEMEIGNKILQSETWNRRPEALFRIVKTYAESWQDEFPKVELLQVSRLRTNPTRIRLGNQHLHRIPPRCEPPPHTPETISDRVAEGLGEGFNSRRARPPV